MERARVENLYEQHKNGIFRYVLSILKNTYMAEDVLHDTFVKVLSDGVRCAPGREQAWLYRVARNLCYDKLRRAKREQQCPQVPADPHCRFAYIDMISALSPAEREIVTLKIVGGLTHKEIAAVMGITPGAARKRYERAIAALREKEDEDGTKTV